MAKPTGDGAGRVTLCQQRHWHKDGPNSHTVYCSANGGHTDKHSAVVTDTRARTPAGKVPLVRPTRTITWKG